MNKVDMYEFKVQTLFNQGGYCPVTQQKINEPDDGEILYLDNVDFLISQDGLSALRQIYGKEFINDRIIYSATTDGEYLTREGG